MEFIKKEKAEFYSGDGYSGMDYTSTDKDINFAVIKINSRSPKTGFHRCACGRGCRSCPLVFKNRND